MDSSHAANTKRIAKNTLFLYGRMLFGMFVSLYTSRVILQALGVEDFGVYNIAGGFVGMMSFLNASLSGASSRFITFELGKGDKESLRNTFSSSLIIHFILALFIGSICETVGLWFLEYKLVIPADRMFSARILYQLSVVSTMLGIINTPFGACMTAHERLNVYAIIDVGFICLKLVGVFLLMFLGGDKLILWGVITFVLGLLSILVSYTYCRINFEETKFKFIWDKNILKPMLSFSGWDLYGNASVMARTQGVNILLNMFFGTIVNAAAGIASQVQNAVMGLGSNIITAFRPQIIKQYAAGDYSYMFSLFSSGMKLTCILLAVLSVPLMVELNFVLKFWLGIVPEYTVVICRYTLLFNYFAGISLLLACIIHATGKIKRISLINGTLYLLVIPISYICFKLGFKYTWLPFMINVVAIFVGIISNAWSVKLYIPSFNFLSFIWKDYFRCLAYFGLTYYIVYLVASTMEDGWLRLFVCILISMALCLALGLYGLFEKSQRDQIVKFCLSKLPVKKLCALR